MALLVDDPSMSGARVGFRPDDLRGLADLGRRPATDLDDDTAEWPIVGLDETAEETKTR